MSLYNRIRFVSYERSNVLINFNIEFIQTLIGIWDLRNGPNRHKKKPCGFAHLRQHVSKQVAAIQRSNGDCAHSLPLDLVKFHTPETRKNE